jgi:hypothetical protein
MSDDLLAVRHETRLYQIYPQLHVYVRVRHKEVRTNVTVMAKFQSDLRQGQYSQHHKIRKGNC